MLSDLTCWYHGWQGPVRDSHMLTTDGPPLPSPPCMTGREGASKLTTARVRAFHHQLDIRMSNFELEPLFL